MQHKYDKGDQMKTSYRCGKPLIITCQSPKTSDPGKRPLVLCHNSRLILTFRKQMSLCKNIYLVSLL